MLSRGAAVFVSVTLAAHTVTVQVSPAAKSTFGLTVNVVFGLADTAEVCAPLVVQEMATGVAPKLTDSLNVRVMSVLLVWFVAPLVGVVAVTVGAASVVKLKT